MLTRVPLAGPQSGVPAWKGSVPTWIRFVHAPSHAAAPGTVVYDPEHASVLRKLPELELVLVARHVPGRAGVGMLASQALMFEAQYGRPFTSCLVICGEADPAIAYAYETIPKKYGLSPVRVAEVGQVDAPDDDSDEDTEESP